MPALFFICVYPRPRFDRGQSDSMSMVWVVCWAESSTAMTLGLAGHQLTAAPSAAPIASQKGIYPRHFGLVLTDVEEWQALSRSREAQGSRVLSAASSPVSRDTD